MRKMAIIALAFTISGCATITRGTTDQVQIHSNPPNANVRTSMGFTCVTPCTLKANRKDEFTVTFAKAGYHTAEIPVTTRVAPDGAVGFAGNVVVGGLVGIATDAVTGATLEHYPNPVDLTPTPLARGEKDSIIRIKPKVPAPTPQELSPRGGASPTS